MFDSVLTISPWHWMALGVLLLAAEAFGIGGFLVGAAAAALVTAVLAWLGAEWTWQLICFGGLTFILSVAYWKYFKNFNQKQTEGVTVNDKMETMIGKTGSVVQVLSPTQGKVMIGDTLWDYVSESELEKGNTVKVCSYDGTVLRVDSLT